MDLTGCEGQRQCDSKIGSLWWMVDAAGPYGGPTGYSALRGHQSRMYTLHFLCILLFLIYPHFLRLESTSLFRGLPVFLFEVHVTMGMS